MIDPFSRSDARTPVIANPRRVSNSARLNALSSCRVLRESRRLLKFFWLRQTDDRRIVSRQTVRKPAVGFSTIEVMVMVAIVALSLIPIMGVQSQVVRAYTSYKGQYAETTLVANSLELITKLNPLETPQGSLPLDSNSALYWQATPISARVRVIAYPSGSGDFEVMLFRVDVTIATLAGEEVRRFSVDQLGWSKLQIEASEAL